MKNLKKILVVITFICCLFSCNKDDDTIVNTKQYPATAVNTWDGFITVNEMGGGTPIHISWLVKPNGVMEVISGNTSIITGEWYMTGSIFTCTYKELNGDKVTFQLIKSKTLNMAGFKGLNDETSGAGRINMYVV